MHVDHIRMLGGVCIDYCVANNPTDLLFGALCRLRLSFSST